MGPPPQPTIAAFGPHRDAKHDGLEGSPPICQLSRPVAAQSTTETKGLEREPEVSRAITSLMDTIVILRQMLNSDDSDSLNAAAGLVETVSARGSSLRDSMTQELDEFRLWLAAHEAGVFDPVSDEIIAARQAEAEIFKKFVATGEAFITVLDGDWTDTSVCEEQISPLMSALKELEKRWSAARHDKKLAWKAYIDRYGAEKFVEDFILGQQICGSRPSDATDEYIDDMLKELPEGSVPRTQIESLYSWNRDDSWELSEKFSA